MSESTKSYYKDENKNRQKLIAECESLKKMAVISITFSIFAAFICIVTIPFVYNYLQQVQSLLQNETEFCKVIII